MSFAFSLALLLVCAYTANVIVRSYVGDSGDETTRRIAFLLAFFGCFFATFLLLGLVGFITKLTLVRTEAALCVALLLALLGKTLDRRASDRKQVTHLKLADSPSPSRSVASKLAVATAVVFALCGLLLLGGSPIGFEVQAYHLPSAIHIVQSRSLAPWDMAFLHTYPLNASIFYAFLLRFLPERLVAASDLCFLGVFAYAIYG